MNGPHESFIVKKLTMVFCLLHHFGLLSISLTFPFLYREHILVKPSVHRKAIIISSREYHGSYRMFQSHGLLIYFTADNLENSLHYLLIIAH
jgi:hypothetical protein